ncbi:MAG TPA: hypothetical protein PK619_02155 [bacterium]|nr:hypothetical protein [bacterium]HPN81206.1 hypothetical protein [bacterium]HPW39503.1 hypothetical protein [bacterium]
MKNQQGVIIIFTLVIMSLLLSTALAFSVLILADLRQANLIDNAIIAYYAADAGLEQSLYWLRKTDLERVTTLKQSVGSGDLALAGSHWNIEQSVDYETRFFRQRLFNGQSVKLYFLGRAGDSRSNPTEKISLEWYKGIKDDSTPSNIRLKITFTQLNPQTKEDNVVVYYVDQSPQPLFTDSSGGEQYVFDFKDEVVANCQGGCPGPYDYVVEITAVGGELASNADFIDRISVMAYNDDDVVVKEGITNLTIRSQGTKAGSQQEIIAHLPPRDPLSGILGFVLFSEQDIAKGY